MEEAKIQAIHDYLQNNFQHAEIAVKYEPERRSQLFRISINKIISTLDTNFTVNALKNKFDKVYIDVKGALSEAD
jgi:hypothetical protein